MMNYIDDMNLNAIDLNLLKALDALLEHRSTVLAGQKIGLSQPAVSSALRRLRGHLDDPLFVREGQRLVPTDYALSLVRPLRQHMDGLAALLDREGGFDPLRSDQIFRIAGIDFFGDFLMPRMAGILDRTAPGVRVQLVDLVADDYVSTLDRYRVDVALVPPVPLPHFVERQPLFHSSFVMIARKDHPALAAARCAPGCHPARLVLQP